MSPGGQTEVLTEVLLVDEGHGWPGGLLSHTVGFGRGPEGRRVAGSEGEAAGQRWALLVFGGGGMWMGSRLSEYLEDKEESSDRPCSVGSVRFQNVCTGLAPRGSRGPSGDPRGGRRQQVKDQKNQERS